MLQLKARSCETCDGFTFTDKTGAYDITDNPTGYGAANTVLQPSSFDSYTLSVWQPNSDLSGDPDYEVDLLTLTYPTPDADFFFSWPITMTMMGIDSMPSGVWTMTARGVDGSTTYRVDVQCIFLEDIEAEIDQLMLRWDPKCGCKKGCPSAPGAFMQLMTIKCGGVCDRDATSALVNDLYDICVTC